MKTRIKWLVVILCITFFYGQSQDFEGMAYYKSHVKVNMETNGDNEMSSSDRQVQEELSKLLQRDYILTFSNAESLYKENEKVKVSTPQGTNMVVMDNNPIGVLYKNMKESRFVREVEFMGKRFLVKDSLDLPKWTLGKDKKKIGEYTCYKATLEMEHSTIEKKEGKYRSVLKNKNIVAWYTLEIPITNGPSDFEGLPGLILEVNDGKTTLVCNKIILNPQKGIDIKEPTRGKQITQDGFEAMKVKKNKERLDSIQVFSEDHNH